MSLVIVRFQVEAVHIACCRYFGGNNENLVEDADIRTG